MNFYCMQIPSNHRMQWTILRKLFSMSTQTPVQPVLNVNTDRCRVVESHLHNGLQPGMMDGELLPQGSQKPVCIAHVERAWSIGRRIIFEP